jgi:hypothetical protein
MRLGWGRVGIQVQQAVHSTSKSAASPPLCCPHRDALAGLLAAGGFDLSGLDLVCLLVDGVQVAGHCCVVTLDIAIDGTRSRLD